MGECFTSFCWEVDSSFDILNLLKQKGYHQFQEEWWWPNSGTFEVVVGAVLTQNNSWERVEKAIDRLKKESLLDLNSIANIDISSLEAKINSVPFYRKKSKVLIDLSKNILNEFGSFEKFQDEVSRDWLLAQKGIGFETCDSILNYGCFRKIFVVDNYTQKLVKEFGFEFYDYLELQEWMERGLANRTLFEDFSKAKEYAISHGMVVEYCKKHKKGFQIDFDSLSF